MNYQSRYFINGLTSFNFSYPPYIEWNPQVAYNFGKNPAFNDKSGAWWTHLLADSKVTLTVVNVFDKGPTNSDVVNGRIVMDSRLRRYILSLNKKF